MRWVAGAGGCTRGRRVLFGARAGEKARQGLLQKKGGFRFCLSSLWSRQLEWDTTRSSRGSCGDFYVKEGGREGIETATYRHELFGREVMKFQYASVALARIVGQEYVEKGPLAAALAALMRWGRDSDSVALRVGLLGRMVASGLDEASLFLLVNLIETYLPVPDGERERYRRLVSREEYRKVQEVELTWADKLRQEGREEGREKGREEGLHEGLVQGKRQSLKRLLAAKFGALPNSVEVRIDALSSAEALDGYLDRVLAAGSIEELGLES